MSYFDTDHIHSKISGLESVGYASRYKIIPEDQFPLCSLSQDTPLMAPSPGMRPYREELPHALCGRKVMVRRFDFKSADNGGLGTWINYRQGVIIDCELEATTSHRTTILYTVVFQTPAGPKKARFSPLLGEISNPDGSWPSITPREVHRRSEETRLVYALMLSSDLGIQGPQAMIWAPALANSPPNDSLVQVLTMAGPAPRRIKYVSYVWPYNTRTAAFLRGRGHTVLDDEPTLI